MSAANLIIRGFLFTKDKSGRISAASEIKATGLEARRSADIEIIIVVV